MLLVGVPLDLLLPGFLGGVLGTSIVKTGWLKRECKVQVKEVEVAMACFHMLVTSYDTQ